MFEQAIKKIVDHQISIGSLKAEERNLYLYGYQMLFEFSINIVVSLLIAVLFNAYVTVFIFTIAFLMIRGYVGGYHAKSSIGCFGISACILVSAVVLINLIGDKDAAYWLLLSEIIILPYVFRNAPIPVKSKSITEHERIYFGRQAKKIYTIQFFIEVILLFLQKAMWALPVLMVHWTLFFMMTAEVMHIKRNNKKCMDG